MRLVSRSLVLLSSVNFAAEIVPSQFRPMRIDTGILLLNLGSEVSLRLLVIVALLLNLLDVVLVILEVLVYVIHVAFDLPNELFLSVLGSLQY